MKIFCRSNMACILSLTAILSAQSLPAQPKQQSVLKTAQPNFYITTPQTGVSTPVGQATTNNARAASSSSRAASSQSARPSASSSRVVASAATQTNQSTGYNTYLTNTPQPFAASASSAQTAAATNQRTSGRQSSRNATQATYAAQNSSQVVSTSANYASSNAANYNTYSNVPASQASTAHSHGQRSGLLNKIFHKHPQTAQVTTVSNNNPKLASAAASSARYSSSKLDGVTQSGQASWYGSDFHGGKTANGERYNMESMTAAHKSLPFGTMVCVRNERNGRECVVRINNRGPFIKGRILDVSKAAARELGMVSSGVAKVTMRVVGRSSS